MNTLIEFLLYVILPTTIILFILGILTGRRKEKMADDKVYQDKYRNKNRKRLIACSGDKNG